MQNLLIKAENLNALSVLLNNKGLKGKIDLVYIDPPFATGLNFKISEDRATTISRERKAKIAYKDVLRGDDFIDFLRQRLLLLRELMSEKASIYLHTDYKIGHYVKVLMDEIFGIENFRNDIARIKCNPKNFKRKGFGNVKDMILFYSKTNEVIWNEPYEPYSEQDIERLFKKIDRQGRRYTTVPLHAPGETLNGKSGGTFKGLLPPKGRHWRTDIDILNKWDEMGLIEWSKKGNPRKIIYAEEQKGKRFQDVWEFKDPQYTVYPTEKNAGMLDLIIKTSSHVDSIVLDCFCGSGTTLKAAQLLKRKWIGIDESPEALDVAKQKLALIDNCQYNFLEI